MKKLLFVLLLCPLISFAQVDTVKKTHEVFCMVTASARFSKGMKLDVDFGQEVENYTPRQNKEAGALASFTMVVQGLNYMAQQGWTLVNSYSLSTNTTYALQFVFKRKEDR